jgi:hypothetical protein
MNKDNITTTEELRQCIGRPIVCYYYDDWILDRGDVQRPNRNEEHVSFMWMFVLTKISNNGNIGKITVRGATLEGKCMVVLINKQGKQNITTPYFFEEEGHSTAQSYVRLPTKDELKIYNKFYRHKQQ